jgi:hypothetical protein
MGEKRKKSEENSFKNGEKKEIPEKSVKRKNENTRRICFLKRSPRYFREKKCKSKERRTKKKRTREKGKKEPGIISKKSPEGNFKIAIEMSRGKKR